LVGAQALILSERLHAVGSSFDCCRSVRYQQLKQQQLRQQQQRQRLSSVQASALAVHVSIVVASLELPNCHCLASVQVAIQWGPEAVFGIVLPLSNLFLFHWNIKVAWISRGNCISRRIRDLLMAFVGVQNSSAYRPELEAQQQSLPSDLPQVCSCMERSAHWRHPFLVPGWLYSLRVGGPSIR
jgi:hypothetical protein